MNLLLRLLGACWLLCAAGAVPAQVSDAAPPLTLRVDLMHSGDAKQQHYALDRVVVTYFQAPHSYTGEDVVELSAHGSPVILRTIVASAVAAGARLARPGEFTLRAFLSGRLDLVQAEAVRDLIAAATPLQARNSI